MSRSRLRRVMPVSVGVRASLVRLAFVASSRWTSDDEQRHHHRSSGSDDPSALRRLAVHSGAHAEVMVIFSCATLALDIFWRGVFPSIGYRPTREHALAWFGIGGTTAAGGRTKGPLDSATRAWSGASSSTWGSLGMAFRVALLDAARSGGDTGPARALWCFGRCNPRRISGAPPDGAIVSTHAPRDHDGTPPCCLVGRDGEDTSPDWLLEASHAF